MEHLINAVLDRLQSGQSAALCCVLESVGSAPRGAGARMAVFSDGTTLGTVGGGAMEQDAIRQAGELLKTRRSLILPLDLRQDGAQDLGMVCGGSVLLGFHCLDPQDRKTLSVLERLQALLRAAKPAWVKTVWQPDGAVRLELIEGEDLHNDGDRLPKAPVLSRNETETVFLEPLSRPEQVWVFGAGHVGQALVPALAAAGFEVTVLDERPALADPARFPAAKTVLCGDYPTLLPTLAVGPGDYIAVMTQGHLADYTVLEWALGTEAAYIGCIGSVKKAAFVNDKLRAAGFSEADVSRIHSPIGLPILAQTPEEIAVSITAEMILHRHGG